MRNIKHLDCTLRDGGYYNNWDFSPDIIKNYLAAMAALNIDYVEIGLRSLRNDSFKGGCAFSTDEFLNSLGIPSELEGKIGVMVNGAEFMPPDDCDASVFQEEVLGQLFVPAEESLVRLVRIACHVHEFERCLPVSYMLKDLGYQVGFNLMQVADRSLDEITKMAAMAEGYPIDALYFADSMGSLDAEQTSKIVLAFKAGWSGELGIHTHDNMGYAVTNSMQAVSDGVTWVDSTVTGMGRGPGNAQTEYLSLALENLRLSKGNPTKLYCLISEYFRSMQAKYGWGTNPFYYLAGKFGIHPSYIQEMLSNSRYSEEDIVAVIEQLKIEGGKKFNINTLEGSLNFYSGKPRGTWAPASLMMDREVLIVGAGASVKLHRVAIESYIRAKKPVVIALNTQSELAQEFVDIRAACHPVRLLADCDDYLKLPQALVVPAGMLPLELQEKLKDKELLDFGVGITPGKFSFSETKCLLPKSLVLAYALAVATSGGANSVSLVGFDGYAADDPRAAEVDELFKIYSNTVASLSLVSLTPTKYALTTKSIYGMRK
ncbi:4-hydroxy 2-oxovalerate aldolase [Zhongshania antarctica]|uniref:4-hydroxy 2-oxovalerate aldolase n=1 Tax=Zhongshania antarctica TaxID=641702 RepID=A0A840R3L6_9GAMM|nr:aldolase catalytic domain-containing protein [Zhongshania antarctica]MBB5187725.1 4-hydroxy 2-oxovalerate aldolase [Zhongshania antarctica]